MDDSLYIEIFHNIFGRKTILPNRKPQLYECDNLHQIMHILRSSNVCILRGFNFVKIALGDTENPLESCEKNGNNSVVTNRVEFMI